MLVPNEMVVRSLVRIPGTGRMKKIQPTILDLSKVSTLVAASRTGGQPLPPQLLRSTVEENNEDFLKKKKRKREEEQSPSNEEEESKKKKRKNNNEQPTTISIPMIRLVRPITSTTTTVGSNATATAVVVIPIGQSLQQLMAERDRLVRENMDLCKRLSLFQQLFRDKKRLTSVVQYIMQE